MIKISNDNLVIWDGLGNSQMFYIDDPIILEVAKDDINKMNDTLFEFSKLRDKLAYYEKLDITDGSKDVSDLKLIIKFCKFLMREGL